MHIMHLRSHIITRGIFSFLLLFSAVLAACNSVIKNDVASGRQDLDQSANLASYESSNLGIKFIYPQGWAIEEVDSEIYLAAGPEQFPWRSEFYSSPREPYYNLYEISPYNSRLDRLLGRPQSVEEIGAAIARTFEVGPIKGTLLEPISSLEFNGYDAASLVIKTRGAHYIVLVAIAPNRVIALSGDGAVNQIDEMRAIVDDIAFSLRLVE